MWWEWLCEYKGISAEGCFIDCELVCVWEEEEEGGGVCD